VSASGAQVFINYTQTMAIVRYFTLGWSAEVSPHLSPTPITYLYGLMVRRWRLIGYFPILYNPFHLPCEPTTSSLSIYLSLSQRCAVTHSSSEGVRPCMCSGSSSTT
jgi:hypothetical protein